MSTSNVNKIEIELHKEIKKNGAARSLRAALWRFAQLAHYIRPLKGKLYVINLVPSLVKITERNEELVHETLANSLPKIMSSLGCFTSDNDIKTLLKALFSNVAHNSPSIRRSTASCILTICLNCRKPYVFITYALNNILGELSFNMFNYFCIKAGSLRFVCACRGHAFEQFNIGRNGVFATDFAPCE